MVVPPLEPALVERLAADPHRPRYHFLPPAHWMNDPNGLILWRGEYHLFYQHNPNGAFWGTMHWGHARSRDLISWEHLPVALAPTPGGPDGDGCFSGCAVDDDGIPTLVYTGVDPQVQCLATGSPDLRTWTKYPGNPIMAAPPEGFDPVNWRDPRVWREGAGWCAAVGSGTSDGRGAVLLYRSGDLRHWQFVGPLCLGEEGAGRVWECPDLFPLGGRHVLVVSPVPLRRTLYLTGDYHDGVLAPVVSGTVDHGGHFYAPQTLLDARGRRIMFGWVWEGRSAEAQRAAGWAGVMSLPRELSLLPDGALGARPVVEVDALRGEYVGISGRRLSLGRALPEIAGDCLELRVTWEAGPTTLPDRATSFGLAVRRSPDGEEETRIAYDCLAQRLVIDRTQSSLDPTVGRETFSAPLPLAAGEDLTLRVYVDRSMIEVYANDRVYLTTRCYPTRADSLGVALWSHGGQLGAALLEAWPMGAIW